MHNVPRTKAPTDSASGTKVCKTFQTPKGCLYAECTFAHVYIISRCHRRHTEYKHRCTSVSSPLKYHINTWLSELKTDPNYDFVSNGFDIITLGITLSLVDLPNSKKAEVT